MQKRSTGAGIRNFLRVAWRAALRPSRLFATALGIGVAVAVPPVAVITLIGTAAAVVGMSWADINDPDFISKVLAPQDETSGNDEKSIKKLIDQLGKIAKEQLYPEVMEDIDAAKDTLQKIAQVFSALPPAEKGSLDFVVEQIGSTIDRLQKLAEKEQLARKFLKNEDVSRLEMQLKRAEEELESVRDSVAKKQLRKVIEQKRQQIENYQHVADRLVRIDAYIANIRAALFTTYSNLTKMQLRDDFSLVDETDMLTESMRQVVSEIDTLDEVTITPADSKARKSSKRSQKVSA